MSILKKGDKGQKVINLQKLLMNVGFFKGVVDGDFGPNTEANVKQYQLSKGLYVDGVVGDKVWTSLKGGSVHVWQLTDKDIELAAKTLNCDLAAIKAVSEVESSGSGFHETGEIKVLYERHIMYRYLKSSGLNLLADIASTARPDLVNVKTGGYRGGKLELVRLTKASELNPEVAHMSVSMGRYQIMGFHFESLGFKSAIDMFKYMSTSEGTQLEVFCKFIKNDSNLHKALRAKDWTTFARIYNGPQFKKNNYDSKLNDAYNRHLK